MKNNSICYYGECIILRKPTHPNLSLIIPVYNEAAHIEGSLKMIEEQLKKLRETYEIIIVDDGSTDATYKILSEELGDIKGLKIIKLSRNFGKEAAIIAGIEKCNGEAAIVMDADLQHPPSLYQGWWNCGSRVMM